jgi:hypothetical protein
VDYHLQLPWIGCWRMVLVVLVDLSMLLDLAAPLTAISRSVIPPVGCFSCTSLSQVTCCACVFQMLSHLTFQTCFPFPPVFFSFKALQLWCQYSQVFCCLEAESTFFNISAVLCESGAWDADACFSSSFSVSSNTRQCGQVNKSGCLPCHKCEHPPPLPSFLAMLHIFPTRFSWQTKDFYIHLFMSCMKSSVLPSQIIGEALSIKHSGLSLGWSVCTHLLCVVGWLIVSYTQKLCFGR